MEGPLAHPKIGDKRPGSQHLASRSWRVPLRESARDFPDDRDYATVAPIMTVRRLLLRPEPMSFKLLVVTTNAVENEADENVPPMRPAMRSCVTALS